MISDSTIVAKFRVCIDLQIFWGDPPMFQASLIVFRRSTFKSHVGSYLILSNNFILIDLKNLVFIAGSKTKKLAECNVPQAKSSLLGENFLVHKESSICYVRGSADRFSIPTQTEVNSFILTSRDLRIRSNCEFSHRTVRSL